MNLTNTAKKGFLFLSFVFFVPLVFSAQNVVEDIGTLIQAGKLAEAENLTNRYLVDDPVNIDLLMMKGNVILNKYIIEQQAQLSLRPNYDESIYDINQLEKGPRPVTVNRETAERVAKLWGAAAILDPSREDMHLGLCQVYAIAGMKDELLAYLPTVKEKVANVEDLHYQMANYARNLKERGDFEGAMAVYKKIYELFPAQKGLLSDIAGEYFFVGELDSARYYIARSLDDENADEATLGNGFFISSLLGDYDKALEAIRRLPGNGDLLYEGVLGFYRNEKKWEKPLKKFLQERPDSTDAKAAKILLADGFKMDMEHYLALIEIDLGDATKILVHQKFRETGEFLPAFNAAETYCFHKRYAAANDIFDEIEKRNFDLDTDDHESLLFYHAWALRETGQKEEAKDRWEQLLGSEDFYKKSAAHWFVGRYYFDKGEQAKGREYFAKMAGEPSASKYATMCWNYMGE
ncbi:MAG TPA: tetratricopeptide repeat protein [Bacteroidetes bacterium]|nr:tetratricopeptide repeat protein [Bacteroidota bacterium]